MLLAQVQVPLEQGDPCQLHHHLEQTGCSELTKEHRGETCLVLSYPNSISSASKTSLKSPGMTGPPLLQPNTPATCFSNAPLKTGGWLNHTHSSALTLTSPALGGPLHPRWDRYPSSVPIGS